MIEQLERLCRQHNFGFRIEFYAGPNEEYQEPYMVTIDGPDDETYYENGTTCDDAIQGVLQQVADRLGIRLSE